MKKEPWSKVRQPLEKVFERYASLNFRDAVIVGGAYTDLALEQLIQLRIVQTKEGAKAYKDLSGQEGSPLSSWAARQDLAVMLGLLEGDGIKMFTAMRNLRNLAAHRVDFDITAHDVQAYLEVIVKIFESMMGYVKSVKEEQSTATADNLLQDVTNFKKNKKNEQFACLVLKHVFIMQEGLVGAMYDAITPIETLKA